MKSLELSELLNKWPTEVGIQPIASPLHSAVWSVAHNEEWIATNIISCIQVLPLGARVGGLTQEAAAHLGLPPGVPVAQGGADAFIGMLGLVRLRSRQQDSKICIMLPAPCERQPTFHGDVLSFKGQTALVSLCDEYQFDSVTLVVDCPTV